METKNILCVDLKSFFAACECVDRGLNMFTTPLVVSDPARGSGAVTLAVTPYLKSLGVKSRGRIYEIPPVIKYLRVKPRMGLYIAKSKEVINVYLDFFSKDDIYIYSVDEVFIDATEYLKLYQKDDYTLAEQLLTTIYERCGLTAVCGIGPNMLLAKLAMDIEAKKNKDNIAKWNYSDIPKKLWSIEPLSQMWGIGYGMEKKLNALGLCSIGDVAHYSKNKLIAKFGVLGGELWNHSNGIDLTTIKECNNRVVKEKSLSHSQILFKDYYKNNIKIIIREMVLVLMVRLREINSLTGLIHFGIGYSKTVGGGFSKSLKLENATDKEEDIIALCFNIFAELYEDNKPIRSVHLSFGKLQAKEYIQLSLFENDKSYKARDTLSHLLDDLHHKYGKNSILNASSLLKDSTIKSRNEKKGGHSI